MEIADLLSPAAVEPALEVASKRELLQALARRAAAAAQLHERVLFDALWERERLGTTGVGHGVAIPHARTAGLKRILGLFARLVRPVDFNAVDDLPVDLVFLLLAPADAGADHLKALSQVARLLRDAAHCERLRAATSADELYLLLIRTATPQAA